MGDQLKGADARPVNLRWVELPGQAATDRTYIARLEFLTLMHLLRWEVSDAAVAINTIGEERVRIGTVSVPVLEQFTELLRRHLATCTAEKSTLAEAGGEE